MIFIIMLGLSFGLGEVAHAQLTYVPEEVSRLWTEGMSNVNEFECQANQYFAEATLIDDPLPFKVFSNLIHYSFIT